MQVMQVFIAIDDSRPPYIHAEIKVDGLGLLTVKDCVTAETIAALWGEVEQYTRNILEKGLNNNANQNS